MKCKKFRRWISDALDGALSVPRRARLERHLHACPGCRAYMTDLTSLQDRAGALADARLPASHWEDFGRRLEARLAAAGGSKSASLAPRFFPWKWAWAGTGLIVLILLGTWLVVPRPGGIREPALVSLEDSLTPLFREVGADPELESSLNQEIMASIDDAVRLSERESFISFGDNPLFWESLSEQDLQVIEASLRNKHDHGGQI